MVTGFKCRRRSTLVERGVESPDTLSRDRSPTKQSSSVFNQLPRSQSERVFGRRSALFSGVEEAQVEQKDVALYSEWILSAAASQAKSLMIGSRPNANLRVRRFLHEPQQEKSREHDNSELQNY
jgi:hypothetical protein